MLLRAVSLCAGLQYVRENSLSGNPVEQSVREFSPGGAAELSPALQRWERGRANSSPGGTTQFSRPLFRAANDLFFHFPTASFFSRSMLQMFRHVFRHRPHIVANSDPAVERCQRPPKE